MVLNSVLGFLPALRRAQALPPQSSFSGHSADTEAAVFEFGMIGFDAQQRQLIEKQIDSLPQSQTIWRAGRFSDADAWLVCGEKTRISSDAPTRQDSNVRVLAGLPSERTIVLDLAEVNRPLAFSAPLHSTEIQPRFTFEPESKHSIENVLKEFEQCMSQLRAQIVLGKQLIEHEAELKAVVYHIIHRGQLLAVADFTSWKIGLLPSANPDHFEHAVWEKRPTQAHTIPECFVHTDVAELRWLYAKHSMRDVLPARYRHALIYFRQAPTVPVAWVTDSHLLVLHELSARPANFTQLAERCGMPYEQLSKNLAGLYFAGSLTTTPSKAASASASQRAAAQKYAVDAAKNQMNVFNSSMPYEPNASTEGDSTVPAQLKFR